MELLEELLFRMSNIEMLCIYNVELPERFLQPNSDRPHAENKLLPLLRSLYLADIALDEISGGTSVDMFGNEFLARLSSIMSPLFSSICSSKTRIESMLVSRPILVSA